MWRLVTVMIECAKNLYTKNGNGEPILNMKKLTNGMEIIQCYYSRIHMFICKMSAIRFPV